MTPDEFKGRYLSGLRDAFRAAPDEIRAGLEEKFSQFTTFPPAPLGRSSLPAEVRDFLGRVGLPRSAAPALNFYDLYERHPHLESHPLFGEFFLIGTAEGGRLLGLDRESGEVTCLDLSGEEFRLLFVNSSLAAFAECLCLFQEYKERNELDAGLEAMRLADPALSEYYSFWEEETHNFFDNVLRRLNEAAAKARGES